MLKVTLHTGTLNERKSTNVLGVLDIAYAKKFYLADYLVSLNLRGTGELEPAVVQGYPRWSANVWDLVARALTQILYRSDVLPPAIKPDRRCAYATRLCAAIEGMTATTRGLELGTAEILQDGRKRGTYIATFTEDIHGKQTAQFEYGCKTLNPAELLLRAICYALFQTDTLGSKPALILPQTLVMDGVKRFHMEALWEPAKTGFRRYLRDQNLLELGMEDLPQADQYAEFLMKS